jgi:hypothetical protein
MTLWVMNEILDYWDKSKNTPFYHFTGFMLRNRFQELHMRVRLVGTDVNGPYIKVSKAPLILL